MSKVTKLTKLGKADKGKFQQKGVSRIELADGTVLEIPIKSIGINFRDKLEDAYPYPEPPVTKIFNKQLKRFEEIPNTNDPKWKAECAKIDNIRVYATVIWGIDIEIEGDSLEDKVQTLLDTGIPAGAFSKIAQDIMKLSGIDQEQFQ